MKLIKRGLLALVSLFAIGAPAVAELPWPECLPCPDDPKAVSAPSVLSVKSAVQAGNIIWGD